MRITDKINAFNVDNKEFMKGVGDGHYDLAIIDPPYGIDINMNMGRRKNKRAVHDKKDWDKETPTEEYFNELFRVSKFQIIWGGNYFSLPLTKSWIFWDKQVADGVDFADGELAWTSGDKTLKKAVIKYSGFQGMDDDGRIHPTQKPVKLYKWLLDKYAKQGDKILDTHGGSMSIGIACHDYKFELDICELDTDYFDAGVKRLKNHIAQTKLF